MGDKKITREDVIERFGFDPMTVGLRHRGWAIITEESFDEEDGWAGAKVGDLIITARDGWENPVDENAYKLPAFLNDMEDIGDSTYRYYYFRERK